MWSAALHISDIPWGGPLAGVRVARVNGELIAFPTFEQQAAADIDLMVACSKDAVVMVEGGASEASEADVVEALMFARKEALPIIELNCHDELGTGQSLRAGEHGAAAVAQQKPATLSLPTLSDPIGKGLREQHTRRCSRASGSERVPITGQTRQLLRRALHSLKRTAIDHHLVRFAP